MRLLVKNIGQLVTVVEGEEVCLAGKDMGQIKVRLINKELARFSQLTCWWTPTSHKHVSWGSLNC